jgi:hypothetical protein
MQMKAAVQEHHAFHIVGQNAINAAWTGTPTTLQVNQNVNMPQTPNGTTILAITNQATQNNLGQIAITSGGSVPEFPDIPALANRPTIIKKNWGANNLSLTNISANSNTPILVQAIGPGIPGLTPKTIVAGTPLILNPGEVAQGNTSPQFMQLVFQSNAQTLGVMGFIGGPGPDNGYVVTVNDSVNTPPNAPAGYYATTSSNAYTYAFNWGGAVLFVANLSPSTASPVTVTLRAL